mmetsp:Transcript_13881/g.29222  ORF Transcript_13881/g.29222 Transcript_13881/m.29222 type:complete len:329 (-) Transcript_13881:229-1215(-)
MVPGVVAAHPLAGQVEHRERHGRVRRHPAQQRRHLQLVATGRGPHLGRHAGGDLGAPFLEPVAPPGLVGVVVRQVVAPQDALDLFFGVKGGVFGAGLDAVEVEAGQQQKEQERLGNDAGQDLEEGPDAEGGHCVLEVFLLVFFRKFRKWIGVGVGVGIVVVVGSSTTTSTTTSTSTTSTSIARCRNSTPLALLVLAFQPGFLQLGFRQLLVPTVRIGTRDVLHADAAVAAGFVRRRQRPPRSGVHQTLARGGVLGQQPHDGLRLRIVVDVQEIMVRQGGVAPEQPHAVVVVCVVLDLDRPAVVGFDAPEVVQCVPRRMGVSDDGHGGV